jgi:uncharacterized protein with NRDE domain
MCSIILSIEPERVLVAANRDEMFARPWRAPARHWQAQPHILAGLDVLAGGTWLGVNDAGVMAAVLNRTGTLGPALGKKSRGALPLIALAAASAADAASRIAALDAAEYRAFNMVVADRHGGIFIRGMQAGQPCVMELSAGFTMVTAHDANDMTAPRIARHLPRFQAAARPDPSSGDWASWQTLLADAAPPDESALFIPPQNGFGTVCSSLLSLRPEGVDWWFAAAQSDYIKV